jgi:hypothetical protein
MVPEQGDVSSPLLFNFDLEYVIMNAQQNEEGRELNETYQFLAYADRDDIAGGNIKAVKKDAAALLEVSREVGLEVNSERTKYMVMFRHQNQGQNHNLLIAN